MRSGLLAASALVVVACGSVTANPDAANPDPDGSGPPCGNGMVQSGEECDDGPNNGPGQACNASCVRNVCRDGDRGPGEACDNGTNNGEDLGDCAPDCSKIVDAKHIILSTNGSAGDLGANPVATADRNCTAGYKAMFAVGISRRATTLANDVVDPIDWVIKPWTKYLNSSEQVVWQTNALRLLGVNTGTFIGLMNPITTTAGISVLTGLAPNWTTLQQDNCGGWSQLPGNHNSGIANLTDAAFINNTGLGPCDVPSKFYCVEQ